MLPRVAVVVVVVVVAADTAAAAVVSTAVAAAVSTAAELPSTAVGLPSTEVWPRAAELAADLVQLGLLPCPAEQVSAECLVEASTTITTSGTSPCLG
jgi:hypothetical protein